MAKAEEAAGRMVPIKLADATIMEGQNPKSNQNRKANHNKTIKVKITITIAVRFRIKILIWKIL